MYIKIRVLTGVRKEVFNKVADDECHISVKEKAERNEANRRVLEIIKQEYGCERVKLVSGHHHPSKIVSID